MTRDRSLRQAQRSHKRIMVAGRSAMAGALTLTEAARGMADQRATANVPLRAPTWAQRSRVGERPVDVRETPSALVDSVAVVEAARRAHDRIAIANVPRHAPTRAQRRLVGGNG